MTFFPRPLRPCAPAALMVLVGLAGVGQGDSPTDSGKGRTNLLSNQEAWKKLPRAERGAGRPLPVWARALAPSLPHTTAAMLRLDYRHRAASPLDPKLRARMRWVAAHAARCPYSEAQAGADLLRAGASPDQVRALAAGHQDLPEAEQLALVFARKLVIDPHAVTEKELARLIKLHGEKQVVAMVLMLAYAGFQDRLILALDLPLEPDGPLPPLDIRFEPDPLGASLAVPRKGPKALPPPRPSSPADKEWLALTVADLEKGMQGQRSRRPRIRLPKSETGVDIHWGNVCRTYQPELAAAWAACRQAFRAEANLDPIFEVSVFWVVTRIQQSFY